MNEIVAFNQTKADLAKYKTAEEKLVFDHNDPQGEKDLRSHIYKLRQARSAFEKLRVSTKADALQTCKNVDEQAKVISAGFTEMIDARNVPLKEIAEREEAEKKAALDKIREDREKEEAARLADLVAKEKELADLKAKEAERVAEVERIAREKKIAEDAKIEAEQEASRKLRAAEEKRVAGIAEAERKAKDLAEAKEEAIRKSAAAEDAEKARLAKIEADRIANESHREQIEEQVFDDLNALVRDVEIADGIRQAIKTGIIRNVTINY